MRLIHKTLLASIVIALGLAMCVSAQDSRPRFEVASIKAITSPNAFGTRPISITGGRFVASDNTLSALTYWTYRSSDGKPLLRSQIVGLPSWAETDRFDVQAKLEGEARDVPLEEMRAMVQGLLEDRFRLKSHRETREEPIYVLTVAKPGKIKLSADQSPTPPPARPGDSDPNKPPRGTSFVFIKLTASGNVRGTLAANAVPITNLVNTLQGQLGRMVVDKTGLSGLFDFNVKFTPEGGLSVAPNSTNTGPPSADEPLAPYLLVALQEELGLKLESARGPVEVLVIDSVSKPSEN